MHIIASEVDFHMHTSASDGELAVEELIDRAQRAGLQQIAITDHDTVAALPRARQLCQQCGLKLVAGVEVSSRWANQDIHVVGLGIDDQQPALQARLASQIQRRRERAMAIGEKLSRLGFAGAYEAAAEIAPQGVPARPHFAEMLVKAGACRDRKQAFQRYLAAAKPAYVRTEWPQLDEVVAWIRDAGGVAVLAHPGRYKLTRTKLGRLIQAFAEAGGEALEVSVSTHTPDTVSWLANQCVKFGLYASQGSDYHGPSMRWVQLGKMPPLPSSCQPVLDRLNT